MSTWVSLHEWWGELDINKRPCKGRAFDIRPNDIMVIARAQCRSGDWEAPDAVLAASIDTRSNKFIRVWETVDEIKTLIAAAEGP